MHCQAPPPSYHQEGEVHGAQGSIHKKNIARGTTDPGYWVHNSNHPNSKSMLIGESTLSTWSALVDLLFAFGYFLQNSRSSISCFCISLFLVIKMLLAMGDDFSYGFDTLGPLCLWQCSKFVVRRMHRHLLDDIKIREQVEPILLTLSALFDL